MILTQPETPSGIARVRFDIERVDFAAPEASGRQGGVKLISPDALAALQNGTAIVTGAVEIATVPIAVTPFPQRRSR